MQKNRHTRASLITKITDEDLIYVHVDIKIWSLSRRERELSTHWSN